MRKINFPAEKSLFHTYSRSLILTNIFFALSLFLLGLGLLFIFGEYHFNYLIKESEELAHQICTKYYSEYIYEAFTEEVSQDFKEELLLAKRKTTIRDIKGTLEKTISGLEIYEIFSLDSKRPFLFKKALFRFEPLNLYLIIGFSNAYILSWYAIRVFYILLVSALFIWLIFFYQKRLIKELKNSLDRLTLELESGGRLSPLGYKEVDALIKAINKAMERERELAENLASQQKLISLGTFAGGYAHEFNNILQIISINLELIEKYLQEKSYLSIFPLISKTTSILQRGQKLAQKLLYLTKKTETETTDLRAFLENLRETLHVFVPREIQLKYSLTPEPIAVPMSEEGVKEIVINLIKNAVDAIIEKKSKMENFKGEIVIKVQRLGEKVLLEVEDNGIGMTEETKKRLFEPFFTTKGIGKGTGLGLYVIYNLVKNVEGEIKVESSYLKGTKFQVYLPFIEPASESKEEPTEEGEIIYKKILVVDDEEDIRETIALFLQELGLEVKTADNGLSAWEILQREHFDLAFIDLYMPEKGGDWLLDKLKELNRSLPAIVLMTGFAGEMEEKLKEKLKEGTLQTILRKPFSIKDIVKILTEGGAMKFRKKRKEGGS